MNDSVLVRKCKTALRLSSNGYDEEIDDLVSAAKMDLGIAGVVLPQSLDALCSQAVLTYVKAHFGICEDYDRVKASYDEQKAQLQVATGYYEGQSDV